MEPVVVRDWLTELRAVTLPWKLRTGCQWGETDYLAEPAGRTGLCYAEENDSGSYVAAYIKVHPRWTEDRRKRRNYKSAQGEPLSPDKIE